MAYRRDGKGIHRDDARLRNAGFIPRPPIHTTQLPSQCRCGARLDAATAFRHDASPKPGDLTMCVECGLTYSFTEAMTLRPLTAAEFKALPDGERTELSLLLLRHAAQKKG